MEEISIRLKLRLYFKMGKINKNFKTRIKKKNRMLFIIEKKEPEVQKKQYLLFQHKLLLKRFAFC